MLISFSSRRRALPDASRMTFGLRCCQPARRPHPASLSVRVPTVEGLSAASFSLASRLRPCGSATIAVIGPDWLLSSNKILPMLGTRRSRPPGRLLPPSTAPTSISPPPRPTPLGPNFPRGRDGRPERSWPNRRASMTSGAISGGLRYQGPVRAWSSSRSTVTKAFPAPGASVGGGRSSRCNRLEKRTKIQVFR